MKVRLTSWILSRSASGVINVSAFKEKRGDCCTEVLEASICRGSFESICTLFSAWQSCVSPQNVEVWSALRCMRPTTWGAWWTSHESSQDEGSQPCCTVHRKVFVNTFKHRLREKLESTLATCCLNRQGRFQPNTRSSLLRGTEDVYLNYADI